MGKYKMIYDTEHTIDGIEYDDFESAKNNAIETLIQWIVEEQYHWEFDENWIPHLTQEQIDSWDMMIYNCSVCVVGWNEELNTWNNIDDGWYPSYEDENGINWLYWEELKAKHKW